MDVVLRHGDTELSSSRAPPGRRLTVHIPKVRTGCCFPALLAPRRRTVVAAVGGDAGLRRNGVMTRRVDDLVVAMRGTATGRSEVSQICAQIEQDGATWRSGPVDERGSPPVLSTCSAARLASTCEGVAGGRHPHRRLADGRDVLDQTSRRHVWSPRPTPCSRHPAEVQDLPVPGLRHQQDGARGAEPGPDPLEQPLQRGVGLQREAAHLADVLEDLQRRPGTRRRHGSHDRPTS